MVNIHPDELKAVENTKEFRDLLEQKTPYEPIEGRSNPQATPFFTSRCAILRTYQHDIELLAPAPASPRTICKKTLRQTDLIPVQNALRPFQRLNLLLCIPTLSLAIVASQAGRAALITLTRPDDAWSVNGPVVSFRIDAIVPTPVQQRDHLMPQRPLLGIAVAPVQTAGGVLAHYPKRWRLIMHYYDHTVLSYELSRDGETDVLIVL
jgi:hypothetical protein